MDAQPPPPSAPSATFHTNGHSHREHASIPDIERDAQLNLPHPPRAHLDPEKASYLNPRQEPHPNVTHVVYGADEYPDKGPNERPLQLLLFLSGPCVVLSILVTLWTLLSLLTAFVLHPLRLCSTARPSLTARLTSFLAPPLNLQLHLIYSLSYSTEYTLPMLILVLLFSPIVAIGVAVGAWTAACFWFFSAILGDPAGQDQGHNDGKDTLLGVRNWWDRWLSRGLKHT
ncbi:uncharacterized protein EI97DRAFT_196765 [Westerdykella ornata]|uniref:Uncharacterized protein n=1 Tax=Westerdykella ornata TaxID=318751 RepID=A0A6A6J9F8_WESOR|nr:uncharacterized protein EI97DRAFT_196765 [Westerdykella ornata]KAF2272813.1 hypothetical protein EI97DRAFT_196765 [Westerdykella ornata]